MATLIPYSLILPIKSKSIRTTVLLVLGALWNLQPMKCGRFLFPLFLHPSSINNHYSKKRKNAITIFSDTLAANVKTPNNLYMYFERHKVNFGIYRGTLSGKNYIFKSISSYSRKTEMKHNCQITTRFWTEKGLVW